MPSPSSNSSRHLRPHEPCVSATGSRTTGMALYAPARLSSPQFVRDGVRKSRWHRDDPRPRNVGPVSVATPHHPMNQPVWTLRRVTTARPLPRDRSFEDGIDRPAVQLIGTPAESPTAAWALATATTHALHPVGPRVSCRRLVPRGGPRSELEAKPAHSHLFTCSALLTMRFVFRRRTTWPAPIRAPATGSLDSAARYRCSTARGDQKPLRGGCPTP
jgi:hypothetical protein